VDATHFVLVFARVSVLVALLPVFGSKMIPGMFKAGLALVLTLLIAPFVPPPPSFQSGMVPALAKEVLFGAALGFSIKVVFSAVEMGAQWASIGMGLSVAGVFDPQFGAAVSPLSRFHGMIAIVLFFALDMHHAVLVEMVRSFSLIPDSTSLVRGTMEMARHLFVLALRLAAPLLLVQIVANLTLGLLARALPQANILAVGFPVMLGAGLLAFLLVTPYLAYVLSGTRILPVWR